MDSILLFAQTFLVVVGVVYLFHHILYVVVLLFNLALEKHLEKLKRNRNINKR